MMPDLSVTAISEVIACLREPQPERAQLLNLLCAPLDCLGLLRPTFRIYIENLRLPPGSVHVQRHLPVLQQVIFDHVVPAWNPNVDEDQHLFLIVSQYFCPDSFSFALPVSPQIAVSAYSSILGGRRGQHHQQQSLDIFSILLLERLTREYTLDHIHRTLFHDSSRSRHAREDWEDYIRNLCMVPGKVANSVLSRRASASVLPNTSSTIPAVLQHDEYFAHLTRSFEELISKISETFLLDGGSGRVVTSLTSSVAGSILTYSWCSYCSASDDDDGDELHALSFFLNKLVNVGLFPSVPGAPSTATFFGVVLPIIRSKKSPSSRYFTLWSNALRHIPSSHSLYSVICAALSSLSPLDSVDEGSLSLSSSHNSRRRVKTEARLLHGLFGPLAPKKNAEVFDVVVAALDSKRQWDLLIARYLVCWAALDRDPNELRELMFAVEGIWTSSEFIRRSLLGKHQFITFTLLTIVSHFPKGSQPLQDLALSPKFIKGVGTYLGQLDSSVRQCGMLTAEIVARQIGKELDFGIWEGTTGTSDGGSVRSEATLAWAKGLRKFVEQGERDVDFDDETNTSEYADGGGCGGEESTASETMDGSHAHPQQESWSQQMNPILSEADSDDDSLIGYSSESSRSPSPTPSELEEMEKEPTIAAGIKRVQRPVYLMQLAGMLQGPGAFEKEDPRKAADTLQVALDSASGLIRRKVGYGTELEDNTTNLVFLLIGLNNNFELENFSETRQAALDSLVACCPRKAAPCIAQELFNNQYSIEQRYVMLNALVAGAEELSGVALSSPPPSINSSVGAQNFASRLLPRTLHERYLAKERSDVGGGSTALLLGNIVSNALTASPGREPPDGGNANMAPTGPRERFLKIRRYGKKVTEENQKTRTTLTNTREPAGPTFTSIAAEFFMAPVINGFWLFLRDEQMRERRTEGLVEERHRYRSAGSGLVLNPMVLSKILGALTILTYLCRNALEWLAVIAPDALELAVTVGSKPVSLMEMELGGDAALGDEEEAKEASVLAAALDLALVVLEGCLEVDGGRSLGLEKTELLLGTKEWAKMYFERLEEGARLPGGGGAMAVKVRRSAAGILVKVEEIGEKWRRSMVELY